MFYIQLGYTHLVSDVLLCGDVPSSLIWTWRCNSERLTEYEIRFSLLNTLYNCNTSCYPAKHEVVLYCTSEWMEAAFYLFTFGRVSVCKTEFIFFESNLFYSYTFPLAKINNLSIFLINNMLYCVRNAGELKQIKLVRGEASAAAQTV